MNNYRLLILTSFAVFTLSVLMASSSASARVCSHLFLSEEDFQSSIKFHKKKLLSADFDINSRGPLRATTSYYLKFDDMFENAGVVESVRDTLQDARLVNPSKRSYPPPYAFRQMPDMIVSQFLVRGSGKVAISPDNVTFADLGAFHVMLYARTNPFIFKEGWDVLLETLELIRAWDPNVKVVMRLDTHDKPLTYISISELIQDGQRARFKSPKLHRD